MVPTLVPYLVLCWLQGRYHAISEGRAKDLAPSKDSSTRALLVPSHAVSQVEGRSEDQQAPQGESHASNASK